jgi:hypothetical protein
MALAILKVDTYCVLVARANGSAMIVRPVTHVTIV